MKKKSRWMKYTAAMAAALAISLTATSARATIVFTLGNNPQPGEEHVQFNSGQTGNTVFGQTNVSNTTIDFTSTQNLLTTPNSIGAGGGASGLSDVTITAPGFTFTDMIFSLSDTANFPTGANATVTVTANEPGGGTATATFSYILGSGQNFLTVTTADGETISSIATDTTSGQFNELELVRVSGLAPAVPEPSTIAIWSLALGALVFWRRRHSGE